MGGHGGGGESENSNIGSGSDFDDESKDCESVERSDGGARTWLQLPEFLKECQTPRPFDTRFLASMNQTSQKRAPVNDQMREVLARRVLITRSISSHQVCNQG